jgi:hypothetical protein
MRGQFLAESVWGSSICLHAPLAIQLRHNFFHEQWDASLSHSCLLDHHWCFAFLLYLFADAFALLLVHNAHTLRSQQWRYAALISAWQKREQAAQQSSQMYTRFVSTMWIYRYYLLSAWLQQAYKKVVATINNPFNCLDYCYCCSYALHCCYHRQIHNKKLLLIPPQQCVNW